MTLFLFLVIDHKISFNVVKFGRANYNQYIDIVYSGLTIDALSKHTPEL